MRCLVAILFSFFLTTSVEAGICGDDNNLIERDFVWDFGNGFLEKIPLPMVYGGTTYPSTVELALGTDGGPLLYGRYHSEGTVGIEYNLYRMQIQIGEGSDAQIIEQDYTDGCRNIPQGLSRGDHLELLPIKISTHADGSPRRMERVHFRFWGK